ncbi:MAB_1171c family putative transporter [Streptomyces mayteni]
MARSLGYWACAAPLWILFAAKLAGLRKPPRDRMCWAVCATVFACAAILTTSAPATLGALDDLAGVPNVSFVVSFSLVVVLAASVRILIVYWREPGDAAHANTIARRWILGYGLVVLAMVILFWAGDAPVERRTDFETYYATTPLIAAFVLLYLGAQAVALVSVIRGCRGWARLAGDPWLRRGLWLITVGSVCGLGVSTLRGTAVAARWFGTNWDALNTVASVVCAMVGLTLGALGFAIPAWGGHLARLRDWLESYRDYRAVYPLWNALRTAVPTIVLPARIPWWDPHVRLTRRLTEINDGRLALWPRTDQRVAEAARAMGRERGLTAVDLEAVVEAALVKGALAGLAAQPRPGAVEDRPKSVPESARTARAVDGLDEREWLTRVSRAFAASPIVSDTARATTPQSSGRSR